MVCGTNFVAMVVVVTGLVQAPLFTSSRLGTDDVENDIDVNSEDDRMLGPLDQIQKTWQSNSGRHQQGKGQSSQSGQSGQNGQSGQESQSGQGGQIGQENQKSQSGRSGQGGQNGQNGQSGQKSQSGQSGQIGQENQKSQSGQSGQGGQNGQNGQNGQSGQESQSGQGGQIGQENQKSESGQSGQGGQNGQNGQSDEKSQSGQGDQSGTDNSEGDEWVKAHNKYRCMHGAPPVKWDEAVAASAKEWVAGKTSMPGHSKSYDIKPPAGPAGENLAGGKRTATEVTKAWYDEVDQCPGGAEGFSNGCQGGGTGHFTALIWAGVKSIGCASCSNGECQICRYKAGDTTGDDTPNMAGGYEKNVKKRTKKESECP